MTESASITPEQVRAGRTLLRWTTYQLAARCDFGQHVIYSFEVDGRVTATRQRTEQSQRDRLTAIRAVLEAEGVEFTSEIGRVPGVRLRA